MEQIVGSKLDYAIIGIYLVFIFGFGSIFAGLSKSTEDYFFAGKRFNFWLIAISCISLTVGSYSFIKYSEAGYLYGLSSTQTYLNDWFIMALFMLGWLPIIYYSKVTSIPEFFEKRFDRRTRVAGVVVLMLYMIGYIGINFYTLGVALNALLGWDIYKSAILIAIITGLYVTFGGQAAVIMTDLAQGLLLLIAGFVLFFLGINYLGGFDGFWSHLPISHRLPFSGFNEPSEFPFVGIFWQDGMANSLAFYFMNQGLLMRFLSCKSVREGRKAISIVVLVLMPLAAIAVSNSGWLGKAMVGAGILPAESSAKQIFVLVANLVARPGVFGLIMAALTAAMMSTVDTLINAVSAVAVNDIWRPFVAKARSDRYYLGVARLFSLLAAGLGLTLVPVFAGFKTIYNAHAAFTAAITPPMVVVIVLGILWKRFTSMGALFTLVLGTVMMFISIKFPILITPFLQGVGSGGTHFMRAVFGIVVCAVIGVLVSLLSKPRREEEIKSLVVSGISWAKELFKGGKPNDEESGEKIKLILKAGDKDKALVHPEDLARLKAEEGDILYIRDVRIWTMGLFGVHTKVEEGAEKGVVYLSWGLIKEGFLRPGRLVNLEKII